MTLYVCHGEGGMCPNCARFQMTDQQIMWRRSDNCAAVVCLVGGSGSGDRPDRRVLAVDPPPCAKVSLAKGPMAEHAM